MTANFYAILTRAIEEGLRYGYRRAHKHGKPTEQQILDAQKEAIMSEIGEVINFDEPESWV